MPINPPPSARTSKACESSAPWRRRYHEEKNHGNHGTAGIIFKGKPDVDLAVEVLNKCADVALPALESFAHYRKWLGEHSMEYIQATDRLEEK